jgi:YD repeat-containing protein
LAAWRFSPTGSRGLERSVRLFPPGTQTLFSLAYNYKSISNGLDTDLRQSVTDAAGNRTAYIYDALNRVIDARSTNPAGGLVSDYRYDA